MSIFVRCKTATKIKDFQGNVFKMPNDYVGEVPDWATKQPYFKQCVEDGTISFVGKGSDKEIEKAIEVSNEKAEKKEAITKEKREADRKQATTKKKK